MINSKLKKLVTITVLALSLVGGVVGCGKEQEPVNSDTAEETSNFSWDGVDMSSPREAYQYVIDNVRGYIKAEEPDAKEYFAIDYYYFDYDQDDANEVILLLTFLPDGDDGDTMADVWYLDYDAENQKIYTLAKTTNENLTHCNFCTDGEVMGRLSWGTEPPESYWYYVNVDTDTKVLTYVLGEAYDHLVEDVSEAGLTILPKHLTIEPIPEDE